MSLPEFQRALAEMLMSPAFRTRVADDAGNAGNAGGAGGALSPFDLSDKELRRLAALARDARLKTGTLLHRSTRLSMLSKTLPRTVRVLGSRGLKELTHAYWGEHPPYSAFFVQEGTRFGRFALERLAAGAFRHPFLREVLETELAFLELMDADTPWEPPAAPVRPPAAPVAGAWVPHLHPRCRAIRFDHPPLRLLDELDGREGGRVPEDLPAGEHYLLVTVAAPGRLDLQELPLDRGRALLACDGRSTAARLATLAAGPKLRLETFEELLAAGYLSAEAAPA
jgi:hypothetical protein